MPLRLLLLQTRKADDPVRGEELQSFAAKAGVEPERIDPHNLLDGPPPWTEVSKHDGLLVGGSGDYYVSKRHLPQFDELQHFFVEVADRGFPMFASCFGFQLMAAALGGEVVHDTPNMEVGTYQLWLTEEGAQDPLIGTLPDRFNAQLGRKDRATRLPEGFENLVASERCPFQAFRVPGQPVWATQFHPELDGHTNRRRFLRYLEGYTEHLSEEEQREALERYQESPETERLLRSWIELVFR